jgi:hypothetical protein
MILVSIKIFLMRLVFELMASVKADGPPQCGWVPPQCVKGLNRTKGGGRKNTLLFPASLLELGHLTYLACN